MPRKNEDRVETKVFYIKVFLSREEIPDAGLDWVGKPSILGPYQTIEQAREFIHHTFATMPSILQRGIRVAAIYSGRFDRNPSAPSQEHFIPEHLVETIDFAQEDIHKEGRYYFRVFNREDEISEQACNWRGPISVAGPYKEREKTYEMLNWSLQVMKPELRAFFKFAAIYDGKITEDENDTGKHVFKPEKLIEIIPVS